MIKKLRTSIKTGILVNLTLTATAYSAPMNRIEQASRDLVSNIEMETKKASHRHKHAKELLGKKYGASRVKSGESIAAFDTVIHQWTQGAMKGKWSHHSRAVAKAVLRESEKHHFDPVFLLAVIQSESSFNPEQIGSVGEIGLMQIRPVTAQWIAEKYNIPWKGPSSLKDPATNIRLGSIYLAYLREKFNAHSQLYIAAYNMGITNVYRALKKQITPKIYPTKVLGHYERFYAQLDQDINNVTDEG